MGCDLLAARGGLLQAHQHAGLDLRARAGGFVLTHRLGDADHFAGNHGHEFRQIVVTGSGIDAKEARIAITRAKGRDRVTEPTLLARLLKEPR